MFWNLIESGKVGASVRRILWLTFWGDRALGYATAVSMNLPEGDVVAAVRQGIWLRDYIRARETASHAETLEAHAALGDLFEYTWQRGCGRGHRPAIEAVQGERFPWGTEPDPNLH